MSSDLQLREGLYGLDYREEDKRRVPREEKKTYDIKAFWQRHHEIVNLAAMGWKQNEIADILHLSPQTVSNTLNSQIGEEKLSELRFGRDQEAKKRAEQIRVLTEKAIGTYHEIFDNEKGEYSPRDKKEAARDVMLELSGLRVPTKVVSASTNLTADELREFKERGIKAAKESGLVIDVEPEQIEAESETEGNQS